MSQQLNRANAPVNRLLNTSNLETSIVHIGLGNFHRAHLAVYTAQANDGWGIAAYSFRNENLVATLKNQDNLYSVLEIGPDTEEAWIPNIHTEFIVGYDQANYVSELISKSKTKIVSLTVTEAGYYIDSAKGTLNLNHPDIENDLAGKSPRTIFGLIAKGLSERGNEPLTILSCDNISHNGDMTKKLLLEFVSHTQPVLIEFINQNVTFPNSMVDRIVPGTEEKHVEISSKRLGVKDFVPVPCEQFSMWVIEDNFAAGKPNWSNVIFSNEVSKFEDMKLMLLNGSHSLLVYLGGLLNCETIPSCKSNPKVDAALQKALKEEFVPATNMPSSFTADEYLALLNKRWQNIVLGDKTYRVGSDGSTKLPQRITKPALLALSNNKEPKMMALLTAAWLACIAPLKSETTNEICANMKDAHKEILLSMAQESESSDEFVENFFINTPIFNEELANSKIFTNLVKRYRREISELGISRTIELIVLST